MSITPTIPSYDPLPFDRIVDEWGFIAGQQLEDSIDPQDLEAFDPKVQCRDYANPKWIPFAEGRNGDYLLIDTDPSSEGTYRQIVELLNDKWERNVVAGSLTALIEREIAYIQEHGAEKFTLMIKKGG